MDITVKGKNLDVGDALRGHAEANLAEAVAKYFANALEADVVLTKEAHEFVAEISVHPMGKMVVHGHAASDDAYAAFDTAVEKVSKQLRRYHRRITNHHKNRQDIEVMRDALVALGAGMAYDLDWLVALALIIGAEELLETSFMAAALRDEVARREAA